MKSQTQRNQVSLQERVKKSLSKTLLLSTLICSPAIYAETYSAPSGNYASPYVANHADEEQAEAAYRGSDKYASPRYNNNLWWIAGVGAASAAAMAGSSDEDKKQHFGVSLALGAASQWGLRQMDIANDSRWVRIALATGIGLVPGLLKEVSDGKDDDNKFDKKDMMANALGSFAGALLSDLIQGPVDTGPRYGVVVGVDEFGLAVNYPF